MKHVVHVYAVYRVPVEVEAENQLDAVKAAYKKASFRSSAEFVFAEEINGFLVDEVGDTDYSKSRYYPIDEVEM